MSNYFTWSAGRTRQGSPTLESQPGAHTGNTRQYIPGYSDSNIVYLDTVSGNDANSGATELLPKLTYSSAATAASTTKKIRVINDGAALSTNITKPTEMKRGVSGTISSSLTAPLSSISAASAHGWTTGQPQRLIWSPKLKKFFGIGSTQVISSADGSSWTLEETLSGVTGYNILWDRTSEQLFITCSARTLLYSSDGSTFSTTTISGGSPASTVVGAIAHSDDLGLYVASVGNLLYSSTDAVTWEVIPGVNAVNLIIAGIWAGDRFYFTTDKGQLVASSDGVNWTLTTPFDTTYGCRALAYMPNVGLVIAADGNGEIYSTTDGTSWTSRRAASTAICNEAIYIPEIGSCVVYEVKECAYSTDGVTWTSGTALTGVFGVSDTIRGAAYSPLLGRVALTGGDSGATTRLNALSPTYTTEISASIAGFSIQAVQYTAALTAYNCTMMQPGATSALTLNACRVTETESHISNNSVSTFQTLIEGDIYYSGTYAAANALDINLNTIAGTLYIYNGSETHYERIRDNIIEGGVQASYPVTVTSGNTRGTSSNGVIFGALHTTSDPLFVDDTDYKLRRVLDGYQYDSPMVAASLYYYNQATTQTFRDNGAWSYNESAASYKYQRTKDFLMPAAANGGIITTLRHNRANLHVADDGTPDVVNTPDSRWEEIVMTYKTLPADHIDFIDWLEGKVDMTSNISLSPSLTPTTSVTASGATSAGEAVITITDNTGLDSGDRLTIDGNEYTVLYTYGTTKVVLDRITTTALSNGESITVKYDTGFYEYQYVPNNDRSLTRWYETNTEYFRGLVVRFARKLP